MFNFRSFCNEIFDSCLPIYAEWSSWSSMKSEVLEHTTGRPAINTTKQLIRAEIVNLNALLPTTKATLLANMVLIPSDFRDYAADKLLGVK